MTALHSSLRSQLEKTIVAARDAAEKAAKAALQTLAVDQESAFDSMSESDRQLWKLLRAEARRFSGNGVQSGFDDLVAECAYAQWHRMLFARFLAENNLLMYDESSPITLADCAELAKEEGDADAWMAAARYASAMLPGIFRNDDPVLQVRLAAEGRLALEKLLVDLPAEVFHADDSLGWVYQFWQTQRKKEVNESGRKIGGADISPVTQLFTEHYMVQFLLHNSLGAWWVSRHPDIPLPTDLEYLRRKDDGTPAAGDFAGWPQTAAELRVLDPSGGSGHFLVAAFALLRRFRMIEENLSEADAGDKVLAENLFGLELDPRCTQIAAFNLALAAWKAGGYRPLPVPNIACSGLAVGGKQSDWTRLAHGDGQLSASLWELWMQFKDAPDVGSLIDPHAATNAGFKPLAEPAKVLQKLEEAMQRFGSTDDPAAAIFGETAKGAVRAGQILAGKYHLVVTNVPYLARGKQGVALADFCERHHPAAKADLATAFVERCLHFCVPGGSVALVTPQNWLFLGSYKKLRENLLQNETWNLVAKLGENGFQSSQAAGAFTAMFVLTRRQSSAETVIAGIDASAPRVPSQKAALLREGGLQLVSQMAQLENPDARVSLEEHEGGVLLKTFADSRWGLRTADGSRFIFCFWELPSVYDDWSLHQSTITSTILFGGKEHIVLWQKGEGVIKDLAKIGVASIQGGEVWGKAGIVVGLMRGLPVSIYEGTLFDNNCAVIWPLNPAHLPAIWAFCSSPEFNIAVRRIDQSLKVTNQTLLKVPFDLDRWQKVADEQYPNGLPEPHSDDPTQWLFDGHPARSTDPLQTAMARLLGYRWPQNSDDNLAPYADSDGIVCLPPVAGEQPGAERLRALLAAAFSAEWSPGVQEHLLSEAGFAGKSLDEWLRDGFFAQHCRLFHNRPFLWHIWDGRKDGFAAIVNYHTLDRAKLEKLIFRYLGDWINTQRDADNAGEAGANARLVAAQNLQNTLRLILEGEPPYDIYVRWKARHEQPVGWEPDLNDGVRLNIRPFVTAGVLRSKFTVNWNKDRGTNPDGSERLNDLHLTRAEKEIAKAAQAK